MISARACGEKANAFRLGFRFFRRFSLAPPCGGEVGAPGGHALPLLIINLMDFAACLFTFLFFLPEEGWEIEVFTFKDIGFFAFEAAAWRRIQREFALRAAGFDAELEFWCFGF